MGQRIEGLRTQGVQGWTKDLCLPVRTAGGRTGVSRRLTVGAHGSPWTVELARAEAKKILGRAANGETRLRRPIGAGLNGISSR